MAVLKKGVAVFLAFCILSPLFAFRGASAEQMRVEALTVNDRVCPVGVDEAPRFSWKLAAEAVGQTQSAYEITVSERADFSSPVWSSGKIEDGGSIGVDYAGDPLKSATRYYWRVRVWNQDGQSVTSDEPAYFETGLLGEDAWDGSRWIKRGSSTEPSADDEEQTVHFTIEAEMQIVNTGVALLFRAEDASNFLMWQLRNTGGRLVFKPHYRKNGNFTVLEERDVTAQMQGGLSDVQKLKVTVTEDAVVTELNGVQISRFSAGQLGGMAPRHAGRLGFRADYIEAEDGWIDNLRVVDYAQNPDGETVCEYNFDDGNNPFTAGSVSGGRLSTHYTAGVECVGLEPAAQTNTLSYTVEADLTCTDTAVSVVFGATDDKNFYMWQLNTGEQENRVLLRPHTCTGGTFVTYGSHFRDITDLCGGVRGFADTPVHLRIDVTEQEIKTYIGGQLVDTFAADTRGDTGAVAPAVTLGQIGTRTARTETGTLDNLTLTDHQNGDRTVYRYTFETENPFLVGETVDGAYLATGNRGVILPPLGIDAYRKAVTVRAGLTSAKLYLTGLGIFDAYLNGERVGSLQADGTTVYDELKPGYTHPDKRVFYLAYDVTHLLETGENVLSANVSSGWYGGMISGYHGKNTAFRAKLLLTYADGTTETIGTDRSWKTAQTGPVLFGDLYNGEIYDANADVSYRKRGFDDSDWCYAEPDSQFTGEISAYIGEPVRVREDLELTMQSATVYDGVTGAASDRYGKIHETGSYAAGEAFTLQPNEKAVIDLGQNFAGWDQITVSGQKGTVLTMRHGEMLNDRDGLHSRGNDGPEGSIYTENLRSAQATAKYILSGAPQESYHSTHTFYGFRYVELSTDHAVTVHGVIGKVVTSVQTDVGSLETGNADVNQLIHNIKWGQYSNYLSIPTDCPQRDERQGWTADTQVFSTAAAYNADSKAFLRKYMQDMRDSQKENGEFPDTAPYTGYGESGQLGWGDAGIVIPYNLYKMYGDPIVIEENYDAMKKFMDVFMASTNKNGGGHNHADWLTYETVDSTVNTLYGVAYYAWDAQMLSEMARVLGKTADAERYQKVYQTEKDYFIQRFVASNGSLRRTEQTACLMALKMDLLPNEASRETVKQQLLRNIKNHGNKLQTGFLGTAILMQTLSEIGADDVAYTLLLQDGNPSWLYSVRQGATTIWERWNSYTLDSGFGPVSMNSFNHYAYGAVSEWMYGYMAGIGYDFDAPGFRKISLAPTPDRSVGFVRCTFDTPYGEIVSNWRYVDDKLVYETAVPANTTATLAFPAQGVNMVEVDINGQTVSLKNAAAGTQVASGVTYLGKDGTKRLFALASGRYTFTEGASETIPMTGVALNTDRLTLKVGETATLTASVSPTDTTDDDTLRWESSNAAVATVQDGVVTAKQAGEAVITVSAGEFEARATVTVTAPQTAPDKPTPTQKIKVGKITLTAKTKKLRVGGKLTLQAQILPANATDKTISWTSGNPKIARVDANGVVTGKRAGKVTVTATARDGSGVTAKVKLTVQPNAPKLKAATGAVGKAVVRIKRIKGVKRYRLIIRTKKGKTVARKTLRAAKTVIRNKKLKKGKYTLTLTYVKNGVRSRAATKTLRIKSR